MLEMPTRAVPLLRSELRRITEASQYEPVEKERQLQDMTSAILSKIVPGKAEEKLLNFPDFSARFIVPEGSDKNAAILYLHGGGYCCGDLEYASAVGKAIAMNNKLPALAPAYRLAPEHPFPAALTDAVTSWLYLTKRYPANRIILMGESAGGGLCYCLCSLLKANHMPLPQGIVAISPWTDLTLSGASYESNASIDPSMTKARLAKFAEAYTSDFKNPYVSPVFADVHNFPESLIFVGADEVMRDDAVHLSEKLTAAHVRNTLTIADGMWHAYILYNLKEREKDLLTISAFIRRLLP